MKNVKNNHGKNERLDNFKGNLVHTYDNLSIMNFKLFKDYNDKRNVV